MAKQNKKILCQICGTELTEDNSILRIDEPLMYCLDCEQKIYEEFAMNTGVSIGLFLMCAKTNTVCEPLIVPENFAETSFEYINSRWIWYVNELMQQNYCDENIVKPFSCGVTNIFKIFGRNITQKDFNTYCDFERKRLAENAKAEAALPGTKAQREIWGTLPLWQGLPLTTELYDELDRMFEQKLENYKGVTLSDATQSTLRRICKLTLAQDYLQSKGDASAFDKVQKSIDNILAAEQLRKKDEKPVEALRIDALVEALENAGLMESGELLTYDELVEVMRDKFVKSKKYDYSLDVADQLLLDVINSMRANADLMQISELDGDFAPDDEYGEFEPTETEQEIKNKQYAGLTKVSIVRNSGV